MQTTMTPRLVLSTSLLVIFLIFPNSPADAVTPSTTPLTPDNACNATVDPSYCKTVLPNEGENTIYNYSCSSVAHALWSARNFSDLIDKYRKDTSTLSKSAIQAIEDCRELAELNSELLQSCSSTLNSTQTLTVEQTGDFQTLLSSVLTNHETCLDGLQDTGLALDGIITPLSKGRKEYSVSLALFTRGWVAKPPNANLIQGRKLLFSDIKDGQHDHLPLKMSSQQRKLFESASGRKLLQAPSGVSVRDLVVVNPNGGGDFTTINSAIAAAPNNTDISGGYFVIYVVAGVYNEYISIIKQKRNLMIIGDGIGQTIITGSNNVVDGSTTFNSATIAVVAQGFVAINITVRNTAGAVKHQAVALRSGADMSTFYKCSFEGYQDTLYTHSNRQYYRECDIYGTVDFIFGNGAAVLQNCNIYARLPMSGQFNALTAQGRTDPNQNTGISIHNCAIRAASDLAAGDGSTKSYLGRLWKEYSRTVYMQSSIDSLIDPAGWREWSGDFALSTLYYAEYSNTGAGSDTANRVTWPGYHVINRGDANSFTVSNFISGDNWLPATAVPYDGGLL